MYLLKMSEFFFFEFSQKIKKYYRILSKNYIVEKNIYFQNQDLHDK